MKNKLNYKRVSPFSKNEIIYLHKMLDDIEKYLACEDYDSIIMVCNQIYRTCEGLISYEKKSHHLMER